MALTAAQERFCQEYLIDLNASRAYSAAYPGVKGKSARTAGPRLLTNVGIASRVAALQAKRAERVQFDADRVLAELKEVALSNVADFVMDDDGRLQLLEGAGKGAMRAVASVKRRVRTDEDGNTTVEAEFRLWDKPAALRLAMQHLGMLTDRVEVSGKGGGPMEYVWARGDQRT